MGKHHKVTEKSPAYQGFTPSPNTPFDFSRRSVEDAKILQEKTAKKRLIIGGIREGYTRTHPGENGVRIPLFEVAKLLVDHGYIRKSNNTDVLAELCESFPESNVYLGLNSFIVPAVYLWSFQLELPIMAQWLSYTLQDLTDRADSTGLLLERKFTQKRHLAPGETGSRQIDIHMEEYVAILLNQHFIRADPKSPCIFCLRGEEELDPTKRSVHHILPRSSFKSYQDELVEYLRANDLPGGMGDFGKNQVTICRTPCHDSLENVIEANIVHSTHHPDKGILFVADLYILLARTFASHHLHYLNLDSPKYYQYVMNVENNFLMSLFDLYAPKGEIYKSSHNGDEKKLIIASAGNF